MKYNKTVFLILLSLVLIFCSCSKKNNSSSDFSDMEKSENAFLKSENEFSLQKIPLGKDKIEFECRVYDKNKIFFPLENYCFFYKIKYEVCARCGHTKIFMPKLENENSQNFAGENQADVLQVEWNSPYVSFANKNERYVLNCKTFYENGITWLSVEIFNYFNE